MQFGPEIKNTLACFKEINDSTLFQSEKIAIGSFLAVLFLLFIPFPIFAITNFIPIESISTKILIIHAAIASF